MRSVILLGTTALAIPKFLITLFGLTFFSLFFFHYTGLGWFTIDFVMGPTPPSFDNICDSFRMQFLNGVEETVRPDFCKPTHTLGLGFARRATCCVDLAALLWEPKAGIGIQLPLDFASHTADKIGHWQNTLPLEKSMDLALEFQNIHGKASYMRDLLIDASNGEVYCTDQRLVKEITPLLESIFKSYCAIFNDLAGGWATLKSQFQHIPQDEGTAIEIVIERVQSYISMDQLQDNRDSIFSNFLAMVLGNAR